MDSNVNHRTGEDEAEPERTFAHIGGDFPPMGDMPPLPPYYMNPYADMPRKSKIAAGLLAFCIPGTGHFYLGLMQKGLFLMMVFIVNIVGIVYTVNNFNGESTYIPFVVLLACLIPVVYFYNLFDTLQSTDQVNAYRKAVQLGQIPPAGPGYDSLGRQVRGGAFGIVLVAIGFFLFLVSAKPAWLDDLFDMMGSYVGAVILIGMGLLLFLAESRKR